MNPNDITHLSNAELQRLMADTPDLLLLDVRTPEEYGYLGHIPGARLLPIHELPARWQELDKSAKTVVICEHGVRSMDASHYLSRLGFSAIYNLSYGMAEWNGPREFLKPDAAEPS